VVALKAVGALPNSPDTHVAVMHRGVNLARIVDRLITEEELFNVRGSPVAHHSSVGRLRPVPVSYTHLDVYKRQVKRCRNTQ